MSSSNDLRMASEAVSVRDNLSSMDAELGEPTGSVQAPALGIDVLNMIQTAFDVMDTYVDADDIPEEPTQEFWNRIGCQPASGCVDEPMVDINGSWAPAWVARAVPQTPPSPVAGVTHLRPCEFPTLPAVDHVIDLDPQTPETPTRGPGHHVRVPVTPPELLDPGCIVPTTPPELLRTFASFPCCEAGCRLRCVQCGFMIPGCAQVFSNQPYTPVGTPPRSPSHSPPPSPCTPPSSEWAPSHSPYWGFLHETPGPGLADAVLSTPPRVRQHGVRRHRNRTHSMADDSETKRRRTM